MVQFSSCGISLELIRFGDVMAILVVLSVYFFNLTSNLDSWLGVISVLVTTWVYMNIAIKMPKEAAAVAPSEEKSGLLKG